MNIRRKTSHGQALVMITLALLAMTGMMGLAVDLGWSFFVKKQAQAAADGAALAAVQEVSKRAGGMASAINCSAASADCQTNPVACSSYSAGSTSNLYNGCLYAMIDGFKAGGQAGRQNVTIQSNVGTLPPTVAGISATNVAYWVTVRTVQTIPQLFSAVLGNPTGLVAARATAAVAIETLPNSVYGLDREGDCGDHGGPGTGACGVPLQFNAGGRITAAGGLVLDSLCNGTSRVGCSNFGSGSVSSANQTASGNNYAGMGSGTVTAGGPIQIRGGAGGTAGGKVDPSGTYTPAPTPGPSDGSLYQDPTKGMPQPPLAASAPVPTCGIKNGTVTSGTLGPFNYYSYSSVNGSRKPVPDGGTITVTGTVTFSSNGTCPTYGTDINYNATGATAQTGAAFPAYIFHGGLIVGGNGNTSLTLGQGQYVMDGRAPDSNWVNSVAPVLDVIDNGSGRTSITGTGSGGQMFIFTAPQSSASAATPNYSYPGLNTQISAFPEIQTATAGLDLGKFEIETTNSSSSVILSGANQASGALPATLKAYDGILFWQDRRNSLMKYNPDGSYNCVGPFTGVSCMKTSAQQTADLMIDSFESPEQEIDALTGTITLDGVIYQPRGGLMEIQGPGATFSSKIQLISGAVILEDNVNVNLTIPTHPFKRTVVALIE